MSHILETERLVLRQFTSADAPFMLRLVNEPSWLANIGDRKVYTLEDAEKYLLEGSIKNYDVHGFGFYMVMLKDTGTLIGTCGFAKRPFLDHPDIGFAFYPEYTGMGYAFESAEACMRYAKEILGLKKVQAFTTKTNSSSIKLLEKIGLHFERTMELEGEELMLFST